MKKLLLALSVFFVLNTSTAQISSGGQPISKRMMLNKDIPNITLAAVSEEWKTNAALEDGKKGGLERVAKNIETNFSLSNSGTWDYLFNGDRVWRLKIKANDAIGINPLFKDFYLPQGAKLFVYTPNYKHILGAFTAENNHESGDFSTEVLFGDEMIIEYIEPANAKGKGKFTIDQVGSFFKDVGFGAGVNQGFGDSDACQINVNCSPVGNNWQDEKRGVARILVVTPSGQGWCTGSLVNNGNYDCKNYFLTALHCGDDNNINFNQWVFYFNYEHSGCTNGSSSSVPSNSTTGATFRSESRALTSSGNNSSDFLLLELNNSLPSTYNVYYNGWNTTTSAPGGGVGIHHPSGDVKKISTYGTGSTSVGISWGGFGSYSVTSGTTHWTVEWTSNSNGHGVTEGGSSGSPLFNNSGEIVGTLSGGGSYCTNLTADDQYGKMSYHWQSNGTANNRQLKPWLDPTNAGLTSIAGSNAPCAPISPNDAGISAIINPTGTYCTTSIIPEVTLKNFGTANLTSCAIKYRINTGSISTFNWTGSLAQNATVNLTLPAITSPTGTNLTFEAYTENPNGATDSNTNNDSSDEDFDVTNTVNLPLTENFEGNSFPPANFLIGNADNGETWQQDASNGFGTGTKSMYIDNWDYNAPNQLDWLVTETFDFSNVTNATLTYDLAYAYYDQTNGSNVGYDTLGIAVSTNCGESFYWLWKQGGVQLATAGGQGVEFVPSNSDWVNKTLDLSTLNNETSVQFAFIAKNGYGNNLYIDNINIDNAVIPTPPVADFSVNNEDICIGSSVNFTDLSTNTPTSWNWSFPGGTPSSSTAQNPSVIYNTAGTYNVVLTATNADGSDIETKSAFITVFNNPVLNITSNSVSCFGANDGSLTANASGNGGFTYTMNGNTSASSTFNNLSGGTYQITVTDVNGCSTSASGTVAEPIPLSLSHTFTTAYCNNSNGSITPSATGGTPPYTFSFTNGGNGQNLAPGTYGVEVMDANGCISGQTVTVPNTDENFTVTVTTTNTSCTGNTGTAFASVNGIISGYTYQWSNGQSSTSASNLGFGTHSVTLTNANGCSETTSFFINNNNAPQVVLTQENLDCFGDNDGSATISISGGTPNYNIDWSSSSNNGTTESNLVAGNYNVLVTDEAHCQTIVDFTITQPDPLVISFMNEDEHCDSEDGQLVATATGGTPSYEYMWLNGTSGNVLLNQAAGTYTISVTDDNDCNAQASSTISNIAAAAFSNIVVSDVSCADEANGSIFLDVTGGTGNLNTNWSNGAITEDLINVAGGTYTLTVTDEENCISDTTIIIEEPDPIQIILTVVDNSPNSTSTITANATGGSQIYNYAWNTGSTAQTITNLPIGTYTITVTDSENCKADTSVNIGNVSIFEETILENIALFPNPVADELNVQISLNEPINLKLNVHNALGQIIISKEIEGQSNLNERIAMNAFVQGVYFLELETPKGKTIYKFVKK